MENSGPCTRSIRRALLSSAIGWPAISAETRLDAMRSADLGPSTASTCSTSVVAGGCSANPCGGSAPGLRASTPGKRQCAWQGGLDIEYRCVLPEALAADGRTFDVVLNMEVIEHVADVGAFLAACCAMVKPGGIMVMSTLNRTLKSFALAKVGAEYVLRWLPAGTHDWRKFVKPSELAAGLRPQGFDIVELKGLAYRPLSDEWLLADDVDVNYMAVAVKR